MICEAVIFVYMLDFNRIRFHFYFHTLVMVKLAPLLSPMIRALISCGQQKRV